MIQDKQLIKKARYGFLYGMTNVKITDILLEVASFVERTPTEQKCFDEIASFAISNLKEDILIKLVK